MNPEEVIKRIKALLKKQESETIHANFHKKSAYRNNLRFEPGEARVKDIRALFPELSLEDFELLAEAMKNNGIILKEETGRFYFNTSILSDGLFESIVWQR